MSGLAIREDQRHCFIDAKPCTEACKAFDLGSEDCRLLLAIDGLSRSIGGLSEEEPESENDAPQ